MLAVPVAAHAGGSVDASADGKYCAYYAPSKTMTCVENEADLPAARATAKKSAGVLAEDYILGIFYDNSDYNKDAGYVQWWDSSNCTASSTDIDDGWADTTTWRNRISSFQGKSSCRIKVWSGTSYTGSTNGAYYSAQSNLNVLNDHVWSARFT